MSPINRIANPRAKLIHRGDRTHSHDHVINPVSLRPMKSTVKRPANPIPPDDVVVLLMFVLYISV